MPSLLISSLVLLSLDVASGMLRHPLRRERPGSPSLQDEKPRYSNDWAIEVNGGVEIANQLAAKLGFVNMGQVLKLSVFTLTAIATGVVILCS